MDVTLTTELLSNAFNNNFDVAVVVTGDGDFVPALEEVKRQGKIVYVIFFYETASVRASPYVLINFFELKPYFIDRWKELLTPPETLAVGALQYVLYIWLDITMYKYIDFSLLSFMHQWNLHH